jgi:hypothetical protein
MNSVDINTKYISDCKKLLDYCNLQIVNILKSKLSQKIKNNQINQIKNYFYQQMKILKNKLNEDLASIAPAPVALAPVALAPVALAPVALAPVALAPDALAPVALAPVALAPVAPALAPAQNITLVITPKTNKKALCIGINYIGSPYELNGCFNDVNNIKSKLMSNYGFNETDILVLTDDPTTSKIKPTKTNMLNEIKNLLVNAKSNDLLFLSFSGHGSQTTDLNRDEKDGLDEMILSADLQSITDDSLNSLIRTSIPASSTNVSLLVLFDSCHSGTMLDLKYQYLDTLNNNNLTLNEKNEDTTCNVVMISGCLDKQTSMDAYINKKSQGAMTWSFLESLNTKPTITWKELIQSMRSLLSESKYEQIPQLSSGKLLNLDAKILL